MPFFAQYFVVISVTFAVLFVPLVILHGMGKLSILPGDGHPGSRLNRAQRLFEPGETILYRPKVWSPVICMSFIFMSWPVFVLTSVNSRTMGDDVFWGTGMTVALLILAHFLVILGLNRLVSVFLVTDKAVYFGSLRTHLAVRRYPVCEVTQVACAPKRGIYATPKAIFYCAGGKKFKANISRQEELWDVVHSAQAEAGCPGTMEAMWLVTGHMVNQWKKMERVEQGKWEISAKE